MKAILVFDIQETFATDDGGTVEVRMDIYKLKGASGSPGSEFRFSWIAYDPDRPMRRVLFDSHPPKGPHFHLDDDMEGQPFQWSSIDDAIALFREKVSEHFGKLIAVPNEGGQR